MQLEDKAHGHKTAWLRPYGFNSFLPNGYINSAAAAQALYKRNPPLHGACCVASLGKHWPAQIENSNPFLYFNVSATIFLCAQRIWAEVVVRRHS